MLKIISLSKRKVTAFMVCVKLKIGLKSHKHSKMMLSLLLTKSHILFIVQSTDMEDMESKI